MADRRHGAGVWRVAAALALVSGAVTGCSLVVPGIPAPVPPAPVAAPPAPSAPVTQQPLGVTGRPAEVAFGPRGDRAYVAGTGGLAVLDTASSAVVATIPVTEAEAVAVAPDGARAYVSTSDGVTVVDTASNAPATEFPLRASQAGDLVVSPDGTRLYTVGTLSGAVTILDARTGGVMGTLPLGQDAEPEQAALTPDGRTLRVTTAAGLVEVDTTTGRVGAAVPVGGPIFDLAISPDGARTYVSLSSFRVVVVEAGAPAGEFPIEGHSAGQLAVSADGGLLFVGGYQMAGARSSAVDTATGAVAATVDLGHSVEDVAFRPDTDVAYALELGGTVSVVDLTAAR